MKRNRARAREMDVYGYIDVYRCPVICREREIEREIAERESARARERERERARARAGARLCHRGECGVTNC